MTPYIESESMVLNPLKASGLLTQQDIVTLRRSLEPGESSLSNAMLRLGLIRESDLLRVFGELYQAPIRKSSSLRRAAVDSGALDLVPVRLSERLRMCPLAFHEDRQLLEVVAAVPLAADLVAELRTASGVRNIDVSIATTATVRAAIRLGYYADFDSFDRVDANGAGPVDIDAAHAAAGPVVSSDTLPGFGTSGEVSVSSTDSSSAAKTVKVSLSQVDQSELVQSLERENSRHRIAQEFHRRVSVERSVASMLKHMLQTVLELLPADAAAIWLTDGEQASKQRNGQSTVQISQTILDQTMTSKSGLLFRDALVDKRLDASESVVSRGVKSVIAVPLRTSNGTLGVMYVESISQRAAFNEDDVPMIEAVGAQAATLLDNLSLLARVKREVEHRASLSRFLSPAAVDEVLSGRLKLNLSGELANVTVLFADVRGFTELSQHMAPQEVVRFLNVFFERAVETVEAHHGVVDKFIGDCVMALWGAAVSHADDAKRAMTAALELVERAKKIVVNGQPLQIGVGIHSGPAVVGALGGGRRSDYTAIGSTVNVASRLCSIAKPDEVLVSAEALTLAGQQTVSVAGSSVRLKGIDGDFVPYSLKSMNAHVPILLSVRHQLKGKDEETSPGMFTAPKPKAKSNTE